MGLPDGVDIHVHHAVDDQPLHRPHHPQVTRPASRAAAAIAGALSWIGRWYEADGEHSAEEIATQFNAMLLNGVLRRKPEPAVSPVAVSGDVRTRARTRK